MSTILVTGATGLTGSHVCKQLIERGDHPRALVRDAAAAEPLAALGIELAIGDVTDAASVLKAADGCEAAIHTAALLGGASQDLADLQAVNYSGTCHVLDAAAAVGMRRVVALSTGTFFDTTANGPVEEAPISEHPSDDPYTISKLAAFREAHARAAAGQDVVTCHPGAIYGPGPVAKRAMARTSFNRVLQAALQGKIKRYLSFPVTWVFADDVARGSIAALDHGVSGERYALEGRPQDVSSTAEGCNRACEIANVPHRVEDVAVCDDPALLAEFGPTLIGIAKTERGDPMKRPANSPTQRRLGYQPTSFDEGIRALVDWLREMGRID
ncbi:MAG: NAD-dependent epimerase/dehydratase family protein [Myxococcales bacterium]|nr:MAG: NAD-dependent epimerase/dehydratase family protein [Myxococcales bacterium]